MVEVMPGATAGSPDAREATLLIDAHAHLDQYPDAEIAEVLDALERRQVFTLSASMDPASFERTLAISKRSPLVAPGFGIHPWEAHIHDGSLPDMAHLFEQGAFIGEIGLDYRWVKDTERYPAQRRVFEYQLEIARDQNKFLNVHTAGAEQDALNLTVASGVERVIIHWYSGPTDILQKMINKGFMFTVGVEVLHSNEIREIATLIPMDQLLTETDNPGGLHWLAGETGMPEIVARVVAELACLKSMTTTDVMDTVQANLVRLTETDHNFGPWLSLLDR